MANGAESAEYHPNFIRIVIWTDGDSVWLANRFDRETKRHCPLQGVLILGTSKNHCSLGPIKPADNFTSSAKKLLDRVKLDRAKNRSTQSSNSLKLSLNISYHQDERLSIHNILRAAECEIRLNRREFAWYNISETVDTSTRERKRDLSTSSNLWNLKPWWERSYTERLRNRLRHLKDAITTRPLPVLADLSDCLSGVLRRNPKPQSCLGKVVCNTTAPRCGQVSPLGQLFFAVKRRPKFTGHQFFGLALYAKDKSMIA